jgi:quinol monooxygenase YgiN
MLIFQFHHYVKPEHVETYKDAILANARETLKEPGILRFDVFQDTEDPTHFSLLEVYRDEAAREAHLDTDHFKTFRDIVRGEEVFAESGQADQFEALFPEGFPTTPSAND